MKDTLERNMSGERIRNSMRGHLRRRGITDDQVVGLLRNAHIKAAMLDAEPPFAKIARQRLDEALKHAGQELFFGALTALPDNWANDGRVAVALLDGSSPSRN